MTKTNKLRLATASGGLFLTLALAGQAQAIELREAVQAALANNPEINQAAQNRAAVEEERRQAQGLYGPRVNVEASAGVRRLENATRRALGIASNTLWPVEADLLAEQVLIDFGRNRGELSRQAARTDAAAQRVEERSEFVALNVSRAYFDYLLQQRIVASSQDNLTFHERLVADLREGVARGSISVADQQQAEERLQSARARLTEALEEQENAAIAFHRVAGVPIGEATMPPEVAGTLPPDEENAIELARVNNPRVLEALADLDARSAEVYAARARVDAAYLGGRPGPGRDDIDGFRGRTEDYLRPGRPEVDDLFERHQPGAGARGPGSRGRAEVPPSTSLAAMPKPMCARRGTGSRTRPVWLASSSGGAASPTICSSPIASSSMSAGARCLTCSTPRTPATMCRCSAETARLAQLYAQYRVLAASNRLLEALGVQPPPGAVSNARERYHARTNAAADVMEPRIPYGPPSQ